MITKKTVTAVLAALLALAMCACAPAAADPTQSTTLPATQPTTQATEPVSFEMPEIYDALLKALTGAHPNVSGQEEYPGLSPMYDGHTSLTELGYALADADGDGSPELLLKSLESPFVYDVFTLVDGQLTQLLTSDEQDSYRMYEDGYVEYQWSQSDKVKGTDYFRIEKGELVLFDRVVMDAEHAVSLGLIEDGENPDTNQCYFRSSTEKKEDYTPVTAMDALTLQQSFKEDNLHLLPQFVPLSEYGA